MKKDTYKQFLRWHRLCFALVAPTMMVKLPQQPLPRRSLKLFSLANKHLWQMLDRKISVVSRMWRLL